MWKAFLSEITIFPHKAQSKDFGQVSSISAGFDGVPGRLLELVLKILRSQAWGPVQRAGTVANTLQGPSLSVLHTLAFEKGSQIGVRSHPFKATQESCLIHIYLKKIM